MKRPALLGGVTVLLALASAGAASPVGTPQSNRQTSGTPKPLSLHLFGGRMAQPGKAAAGAGPDKPPPRHRTQAEWRADYIARHHHDIAPVTHPGH